LELADSVSITFEMQKNNDKNDTVTHGQTGDNVLCLVLQWARLVSRISSYPGATPDTKVCSVWRHGRIEHITRNTIIQHLRAACAAIGSKTLGFEPHEIGTHSLCSRAAMEVYLGEVPVYTIMLMGRWLSNAFLCYIRKQVEQFSLDILKRMLNFCSFRHIPDIRLRRIMVDNPPNTIHHRRASSNNPRQRNHRDNAETQRNIRRDKSRWVQLPAFYLYA
jgi:hypothetical protein